MPTLPPRVCLIAGRVGRRRARLSRWSMSGLPSRDGITSLVLWSRLLLLMDMFLTHAQAETHHLCRVHYPKNGLPGSEGQASFRPQGLITLVPPQTIPEHHHGHEGDVSIELITFPLLSESQWLHEAHQ